MSKKSRILFFVMMGLAAAQGLAAQTTNTSGQKTVVTYTKKQLSMKIRPEDLRLVPTKDGYHLYVRKLENVNSVLLTETVKDPAGKEDSYAYRAKEYNEINGDEVRYLDGKPLDSPSARYSLLDSSPEEDEQFGEAFHIFIPNTIVYGYPWSRNGEIEIGNGTFINIRTFEKPYADYTGDYIDSPYMFNFIRKKKVKKEPELTEEYNAAAAEAFKEISENTVYSKGPETLVQDIKDVLDKFDKEDLDVVFTIDATGSMKNDLEALRKGIKEMLEDFAADTPGLRVGLVFYRDYGENFNYNGLPVKFNRFTDSISTFYNNLSALKINGREGGDVPEAVYEAIYASCEFLEWRETQNRRIILIGDAEPHPEPRRTGKYSRDYVMTIAEKNGIKLTSILLPKD